jgi:hypothetical protein
MGGGPTRLSNKIGRGYAVSLGATGVEAAGERAWRNFRRADLPAIEIAPAQLDQVQLDQVQRSSAGMAEIRAFRLGAGRLVARLASHGEAKGQQDQRLGFGCRLMAGLTARLDAQLPERRSSARPRGAASPFRSAGAATRVASASRQIHEIQAQSAPQQCPKLRSSQTIPSRLNGSGPGAVLSTPKNGVRGAGSLRCAADARKGSAGCEGRAGAAIFGGLKHEALAPSVERSGKATPRHAAVNEPRQKSVEKSL